MYSRIQPILEQMGYETIYMNVSEPHLNLKIAGNDGYAVVTIDESHGTVFSYEQFTHISEQIRNYLFDRNCYTYHFLYIIISNDNYSPERLLNGHESFWHIIPAENRLMVYENCDPSFLGLRRPLEDLFSYNADVIPDNKSIFDTVVNPGISIVNTSLIFINILVFIVTDLLNVSVNGSFLSDLGALSWDSVLNSHEYYRVITCMFIHGDVNHIFNNMMVMFFLGGYLEQYVGHLRYLIIYFCSGILAGCTSMVYNMMINDYTASIGASGAIFGLMGGMLCIVMLRHRNSYDLDLRRIGFMIFLSLYSGFTSEGVDNAAHVGGFISGLILTALLTYSQRKAGNNS